MSRFAKYAPFYPSWSESAQLIMLRGGRTGRSGERWGGVRVEPDIHRSSGNSRRRHGIRSALKGGNVAIIWLGTVWHRPSNALLSAVRASVIEATHRKFRRRSPSSEKLP